MSGAATVMEQGKVGLVMTRVILILALVGLAACETTKGFGRDVETAGRTIQRSVQ